MKIDPQSLIQTSFASPSQWDAESVDEEYVYIRYRYGRLTVTIDDEEVFEEQRGDELDGVLGQDELLEILEDNDLLAGVLRD